MITYPLNNIDYTAEDAELFHCTRTSGVWAEDSFSISITGADNNVSIGTGLAWINNEEFSGKVAALKTAKVLNLGISDGVYPRIDVIAIQFNTNNNATDIIVKKGIPATNPVRPAIVRTGAIYELYLASVYRPAGATVITADNITDLRMDSRVCGLMADSVTKVDMDAIRAQARGLIEELERAIQNIEVGEIVPIEKGGTNAQTAASARQNINVIGYNPITSVSEDTPANWATFGTGVAYISGENIITDSPRAYGIVQNMVHGNEVRQVWYGMYNGDIYHRGGHASSGWSGTWKKLIDENHVGKTLWEGSWISGKKTIEGTSDYTVFFIHMSGQGTAIPVIKKSNYIRGVGGYVNDTPTNFTYHFNATFSDDTWTLVGCEYMYHSAESTHGPHNKMIITEIIGLI